jgi:Domain of unknown function (DUF6316)
MEHKRRDDPAGVRPTRSERCFTTDGQWYIATRERVAIGPYPTRQSAEQQAQELTDYLAILDAAADAELAPTFVHELAQRRAPQRAATRTPGRIAPHSIG